MLPHHDQIVPPGLGDQRVGRPALDHLPRARDPRVAAQGRALIEQCFGVLQRGRRDEGQLAPMEVDQGQVGASDAGKPDRHLEGAKAFFGCILTDEDRTVHTRYLVRAPPVRHQKSLFERATLSLQSTLYGVVAPGDSAGFSTGC